MISNRKKNYANYIDNSINKLTKKKTNANLEKKENLLCRRLHWPPSACKNFFRFRLNFFFSWFFFSKW
jgi:hypothetical protein